MKGKTYSIFLFFIIAFFCEGKSNDPETRTCLGTNSGLSVSENRMDHYIRMRSRYQDCKIVQGNLEITGLENPSLDVSFLKDIEVVTGYVIIALNFVPYLPLENLKIIHGKELYYDRYALYAAINYNESNRNESLRELRMKSLTEIVRGSVFIDINELCFANTIKWEDIMNTRPTNDDWSVDVTSKPLSVCGKCDPSCSAGCWGKGHNMCQKLTKIICSTECGSARCRGPNRQDCCDPQCAGGCTGPSERDCIACLNVNNNGSCLERCPRFHRYDPQTESFVPNPHGKYQYSDRCVDKCPRNLFIDDNQCVTSCRLGYHSDESNQCTKTLYKTSETECFGVGHPGGPLVGDSTVNSVNVHHFEGCNIVKGNVIFQTNAFVGDAYTGVPPMNITQFIEAFKNVKVIQGYLQIVSWPKEFNDFSVFQNLQKIQGIELYRELVALVIQDSTYQGPYFLNQITSLGFSSLKAIDHGNAYIGYLKNLCYDRMVNWTSIIKHPVLYKGFKDGLFLRKNKPASQCNGTVCDPSCTTDGCWGPGPRQCLIK